ncbi:MAG: holo-ACP synthase [Candidatus Promineifilaceae bacterium]|jgi:holo-[acyl-carrier protein] synthase
MLAVGVDLIEVARVKESLARYGQRFLDRIYTEQEQDYCNGRVDRLAARFAAKEAVSKALGTGIGDTTWREIEIINEENGRPVLLLHGAAQELARTQNLETWSISLSHTEAYAISTVVAMRSAD